MNKKLSTLMCAAALASTSAFAVPAKPGLHTVTQPDGTTLSIRQVGDEYMHFTLTDDGMLVVRDDAAGAFNYGRIDTKGRVIDTGIRALDGRMRPASQKYLTQNIADVDIKALAELRAANGIGMQRPAPAMAPASRATQTGMGRYTNNFPLEGKIKGVVILVEYKDVKFNTAYNQEAKDAKTYFTNMVREKGFSDYGGTGSAHDYFLEMSGGKFQPDFDVLGPVTLNNNRAYYGAKASNGAHDINAWQMVSESVRKLDSTVDFSQYDNDKDGYVDFVFVIYAGAGEASGGPEESVWPHASNVRYYADVVVDGVHLDKYACSNEWEAYYAMPDGVGTFCHEFSHVLGLPDLYTTNYNEEGEKVMPDIWDVMAAGCYNNDSRTPPAYSIYERNALGWLDVDVISGASNVCLEHIIDSNHGVLVNTEKDTEFFLFENRQQKGWDAYLPGHGMLIWHIDYNKNVFDGNRVNNDASHQYVDIVEANNNPNNTLPSALPGYSWPGTSGNTSFTSTTTPAFKSWSGTAIDLPITEITEEGGLITFKVAGGVKELDTPVPNENPEKGKGYFTAQWSPVSGATDYRLYVQAVADAATKLEDTADMGNGSTVTLPEGWTSSTTAAYTSAGDYGQASPSLKLAANGDYIQSPEYSTDLQSLKFWYKSKTAVGSKVVVNALVNGSWQEIESITLSTKAGTYENNALPKGTRQIRLSYTLKMNAVAIDDIVIVGGSADMTVPEYYGVSTNGATQMRVENLPAGYKTFKYSVKALGQGNYSEESKTVTVTIDPAGVDDIIADGDNSLNTAPVYYNLQGVRIAHPAPGQIVIERRGNTTRKLIVR